MTTIRYFGVSAYQILTPEGKRILIDPFFDENPVSPVRSGEVEADLILVTHGACDHLGDADKIARRTGAPVVCGAEVKAYLTAKGVRESQVRATTWGIAVEVAGIRIQPVECRHWSHVTLPTGERLAGVPMGFIVYAEPGVRIYHHGDTALFSDLKLIGKLHRPTVGLLGVANPTAILDRDTSPGRMLTGEMSPYEGALAACWLGVDVALPCHYTNPKDPDVTEFERCLKEESGGKIASVVLAPGEHYICTPRPEGTRAPSVAERGVDPA